MKRWLGCLSKKRIVLAISCVVSFLFYIILSLINVHIAEKQESQQMAQRWSAKGDAAQVSCFFSQNTGPDEYQILAFRHGLDSALVEASIVSDSPNSGARLWADAYSATGKVTLQNDKKTVTADAVGIGGDFFLFHPMELESGAYFSGNDIMKDYCLVDEEIAWQLFGSDNIAGQMITIGGIPHMIIGVYQREEGRLAEAAGLDRPLVFVSYETLCNYGSGSEINTYEIVMPNPVKNYALHYVQEHIGFQENEIEIIENTSRYTPLSLLQRLGEFGTRSMSGKAIVYPYWENIARGYEDIAVLIFVMSLLAVFYPVLMVVIAIVIAWRHRTWTMKSVYLKLKDKWERFWEKRYAQRRRKKYEKMD